MLARRGLRAAVQAWVRVRPAQAYAHADSSNSQGSAVLPFQDNVLRRPQRESSIVFGSRGNIARFQGAQRLLYTDVSSARVARVGPPSAAQDEVDALQGIQEMVEGSGTTAKMSIVLKSFEKIRPGRLQNARKVGLPQTRVLYTVNRSPHIDKKSREQFEMRIHKKLLVMEMDVAKLREKYNLLKHHNMLGVQLKVNFHYQTRLDLSRLKTVSRPLEERQELPNVDLDSAQQLDTSS
ncbi:unnamed protein product [Sphagnum troendelagicum]|uniref:Small ribosomal subunit protein uS10 domain-containing protein n=1 Tax=Sphagnum troendelagicum TaxID=128251 RepID=A0ABP0UKT4_9BRYO